MELINRNKFLDKITYLIRAKILDEIKLNEDKFKMIDGIKNICNEILEKEKTSE